MNAPVRRRARRRAVAALTGVLLTLALAACGMQAPVGVVDPSTMTGDPAAPMPRGAASVAPAAVSSAAPSASCLAGYRPPSALPTPGQMPTGSTMARIYNRGYLIAGVDQDTNLFGFLNPTPSAAPTSDIGSDAVAGFDVDILHQISQAIFGDPNRIQFRVVTQEQRVSYVEAGQVDIIADTAPIGCVTADQVDYSASYFNTGQAVMVTTGSPIQSVGDLRGHKACAVAGTTALSTIAEAGYGATVISAVNWTDCLVMLELGEVDAISADGAILAGLKAQDPQSQIVGTPFTHESYGLVVAPDPSASDPHDFVRFINGVLEQIKADGTWTTLYEHWIGNLLGPVPEPPVPTYGPN